MQVKYAIAAENRFSTPGKSLGLCYALWFFLGLFGAHNFYLGRINAGIAQVCLAVSSLMLADVGIGPYALALLALWWVLDLFAIPHAARERW